MQYTLALSVGPAYCSLVYMIHAFRLSSTGMGAYPSTLSRLDSPWRSSKSWRTSSWNQRTQTLKIDSIANQECNIKQLYVFRVLHSLLFPAPINFSLTYCFRRKHTPSGNFWRYTCVFIKAQRREVEGFVFKTTHVKTWSYCSSARTYEMEVSSRRRTSVDRRSGRGSLGAGFESLIHLLHHELYVASIPKQSLSRVSHSLLQVLLGLFDRDPKGRQ